jgi:hypothetical protein
MDRDKIKRLMKAQAKKSGMADDGVLDGLIDEALSTAAEYVWKCYQWQFRRVEATLTMTASQEYVELPTDFDGFISLRYREGTSDGWQLKYRDEDSYEYFDANPLVYSEDAPRVVKVVFDQTNGVWRAYFTPRPDSAYNLTLIYLAAPGTVAGIPNGFEKLIQTAAWLFMYPAGSTQWQAADLAFKKAKEEAIRDIDPAYRGVPSVVDRAKRFDPEGVGYVPDDWYKVSDGSDY